MVSNRNRLGYVLVALMALSVLAMFTIAIGDPTGPDSLTEIGSSRFANLSPQSTEAQAGNVSEISMQAQSATKAWQGYFGNVSGTITLEDSSNNVFYDWTATEPEGEVYASTNNSVNWATIQCFNYTADGTSEPNLTTEEARYGMDANDVDGIDETFNKTDHTTFYVGTIEITGCPTTYAYQSSTEQPNNFQNVLLSDPNTNSLVFTSILENRNVANDTDLLGYDGTPTDFQLLVAEDEHTQAAAGSTTYYFWVEIE